LAPARKDVAACEWRRFAQYRGLGILGRISREAVDRRPPAALAEERIEQGVEEPIHGVEGGLLNGGADFAGQFRKVVNGRDVAELDRDLPGSVERVDNRFEDTELVLVDRAAAGAGPRNRCQRVEEQSYDHFVRRVADLRLKARAVVDHLIETSNHQPA